jgi:hypothetical protein
MTVAGGDWYESEPPLGRQWVAELQRLKRRAQARPFLILSLAALLTGAVMFMLATKPRLARARVVIAVTEGDLGAQRTPTSMGELREYVDTVLLPNASLLPIIEANAWRFPLRRKLGDAYALSELRDTFEIGVWRNYFLYQYSIDERRSARIAITVTHTDRDFAVELARRLAAIIIDAENAQRQRAARALIAEATSIIARAHERLGEAQIALNERTVALAKAELDGATARATALRMEVFAASSALRREQEKLDTLNRSAGAEQLDAAVTQAGLGMQLEIADERLPPPEEGGRTLTLIVVGVALFLMMVPLVSIAIGSFDSRIHDLEDVSRLGFPIVGHVPSFPGDSAGSLRDRGVRRRRVPSY